MSERRVASQRRYRGVSAALALAVHRTRQIVVEGAEKIAQGRKGKGKGGAKSAGKQEVAAGAPGAPTSDILSRTAIKLEVK